MSYNYEQLRKMTVGELREIAKGFERDELKGFLTMHKEKLLPLLCNVMGVEIPRHHVEGIDKTSIKMKIRELKVKRDAAKKSKNREELHAIRRQIHKLKHELRKHLV